MTVLLGDTGKVAYGTFKSITVNLPTYRETTGLSLTLPTTEGTAQISYTVQASDIATFNGMTPISAQHSPLIYATGRVGAASATIFYRISVNGTSKAQSGYSGLTANNYWTGSMNFSVNVSVGDIVDVSLWSNQADVTFVYHGFTTSNTRLQLTRARTICKDVAYTMSAFPVLVNSPAPIFTSGTQAFSIAFSSATLTVQSSLTLPSYIPDIIYGFGRVNLGDSAGVNFSSNSTNQTTYFRNLMPTTITFREVLG